MKVLTGNRSHVCTGRFNADLLGRIKNRVSDAVKDKMKVGCGHRIIRAILTV